jgi:ATP-dependent protease ClpP protease subunit
MRHPAAVCKAALLLFCMPCGAAEFFYMDHDPVTDQYIGPVGPLVLSGEVVPGDYDSLLSRILDDENRFLSQNKIILASDGGDVAEALKIARLVKSLYAHVAVVALTGRCVSACFFIYAAANQREADGEHLLGINRPYIADAGAPDSPPPSAAEAAEGKALTQVRAFLHENAVPDYLVDEMFRHPSNDAYWLSAEDEKNLGFRSVSFNQFLAARCAWDSSVERDVYAGKRPVEDLKQLAKCRDRVTQEAAHQVLLAARQQRSPNATPKPRAIAPTTVH